MNDPLKVPFKQATVNRYVRSIALLLVFALRVTDHDRTDIPKLDPIPVISLKCDELRSRLHEQEEDSSIKTAIHELILVLLSPRHISTAECIGSTFIMFSNYPSAKRLLNYEMINNLLSGLKWTFRVSTFFEIQQQIDKSPGSLEPR